jgi:hypothetical protein
MRVSVRNQHYFVYLKPGEAERIGKSSCLEGRLFDESLNRFVAEKKFYLRLGGNRRGIEADLRCLPNDIYLRITRQGKRNLISGKAILANYDKGVIMVQVE